jgi:hypothetical protein
LILPKRFLLFSFRRNNLDHRITFFIAAACMILCCISFQSVAQDKLVTAGLQVKPIFESGLLKTGKEELTQNNVDFHVTLKSGFSGGVVIRRGLSELLSLETGIGLTKRKYELEITDRDTGFSGISEFRIISYEVPLSLLVFIQLGEKTFMNASLGYCLNIFASDIFTFDTTYFENYATYKTRFRSAILANLGAEYRTEKDGYFYLGATFQRPFGDIYTEHILYEANGKKEDVITGLSGSYLTIDLRYYFHSEPQKKKKKTRKAADDSD